MYAATSNSRIYHLTEQPDEKTLCGVKFMPIVMEQPRAAGLSLMQRKPDGYSLCRHCDRVRGQGASYSTEIFPLPKVLITESEVD